MASETCKACQGAYHLTAKTADGEIEMEPCDKGDRCANCGRCFTRGTLVPQDDDEDVCSECDEQFREAAQAQYDEDWSNYNAIVSEGLRRV